MIRRAILSFLLLGLCMCKHYLIETDSAGVEKAGTDYNWGGQIQIIKVFQKF